jgi:fumarate hydratase class II
VNETGVTLTRSDSTAPVLGTLKKCVAEYNVRHGKLAPALGEAMATAADEICAGELSHRR